MNQTDDKRNGKCLFERCMGLLIKYKELIKYGVFGVLTTAVDYGSYALFYEVLGINDSISNALGWVLAVIFAFITNKIFVFCSRDKRLVKILYEFGSFFLARAVTGIICIVGYTFIVNSFGLNGYVTKALLSIFNIVANYVLSKLVIFKKTNIKDL